MLYQVWKSQGAQYFRASVKLTLEAAAPGTRPLKLTKSTTSDGGSVLLFPELHFGTPIVHYASPKVPRRHVGALQFQADHLATTLADCLRRLSIPEISAGERLLAEVTSILDRVTASLAGAVFDEALAPSDLLLMAN